MFLVSYSASYLRIILIFRVSFTSLYSWCFWSYCHMNLSSSVPRAKLSARGIFRFLPRDSHLVASLHFGTFSVRKIAETFQECLCSRPLNSTFNQICPISTEVIADISQIKAVFGGPCETALLLETLYLGETGKDRRYHPSTTFTVDHINPFFVDDFGAGQGDGHGSQDDGALRFEGRAPRLLALSKQAHERSITINHQFERLIVPKIFGPGFRLV